MYNIKLCILIYLRNRVFGIKFSHNFNISSHLLHTIWFLISRLLTNICLNLEDIGLINQIKYEFWNSSRICILYHKLIIKNQLTIVKSIITNIVGGTNANENNVYTIPTDSIMSAQVMLNKSTPSRSKITNVAESDESMTLTFILYLKFKDKLVR
jgi:hypothetical protein